MTTDRTTTATPVRSPIRRHRAVRHLVAALAVTVLLVACGNDDPTGDTTSEAGAGLAAGVCVEGAEDCNDTPMTDGTCLAGDEDCLDEPGDAAASQTIPLVAAAAEDAGVVAPTPGSTDGAFAHRVQAASVDGTTLTLAFDAMACEAVEDVLVMERAEAVEVLVLAGPPAAGTCAEDSPVVRRAVQVELDEALDGRDLVQTP
jgi:hypothetical protein